jgi:DNA-dependent RNA polymerase auxiliary subunit epsilon
MEFIKTIKIEDMIYKVFYDKNLKAINYFCLVQETEETDCLTFIYDSVKELYDVLTEESFKENFESIVSDVMSREDSLERHFVLIQTFKKGFWNEMVMTKFKNCEVNFIQQ